MQILITGATGLVGSSVLRNLARAHADARFTVLVRSIKRWHTLAPALGSAARRVRPVRADLTLPRLDLRTREIAEPDLVIHCAADVSFSRSLAEARAVNTAGTARMLELAAQLNARCFAHVSTAYVAGRRTGLIGTSLVAPPAGWVNAYEQSKYEAEVLVRDSGLPSIVFRPGIIACDDLSGRISQYNSVHRALSLCYSGLAALLPGSADTRVDLVTTDYVAGAISRLALEPAAVGRTFHLCAGAGALRLDDLLEAAWTVWRADPVWRRRATPCPALTDLGTYRLFEQAVNETADARLRVITRALGHFAPQLCYAKQFDTAATDAVLGERAPASASFFPALIRQLHVEPNAAVRSAA